MKPISSVFAAVCLALSLLLAPAAQAGSVMPVNAATLAEKANVAFSGRCVSSVPGEKNGLDVTVNTFEVKEVIKGEVKGPTFTFYQFVYKGAPAYQKGREYILFLTSESRKGLRAPIGLEQGVFDVEGGMVVNARNNKGLFIGVPKTQKMTKAMSAGGFSSSTSIGPVDADAFKATMKEMGSREPAN